MKRDLMILVGIIGFLVVVTLGCIFFPEIFYDRWIWKYYWGPVVADALGKEVVYHGVEAREGYTIVSEVTYGIIAILSLYYIYRLLKRLRISIDWSFCKSLIPLFIFGSVARVLEDVGCFRIPLSYWFISPLIYVQIAVYFLLILLTGWIIENRNKTMPLFLYGISLSISYLIFWILFGDLARCALHPMIFILMTAMILTILYFRKKVTLLDFLFSSSLIPLLSSLISFVSISSGSDLRLDVFSVCFGIAFLVTSVFFLLGRFGARIDFFRNPLNLSMIFAHALDGFTSYVTIYDPFGMGIPIYGEKHPVSLFFMDVSSGILYPIVKIFLIVLIIYIFEISEREKEYGDMVNLLRIAVFILGFSPGLRDLLRVTISV
ncbi:MAG TPA: DUF63 family protein [Thermoplasmatales archaeon]|nr:DUF63 family protein [Thermoplasmatales archaeon]HEX17408.1 DUF63 family protein [Thermoplasmatales archaeon]